ncbi:MAG: hypothetical protein AAF919_18865 [Pseudomonadota bacterium]
MSDLLPGQGLLLFLVIIAGTPGPLNLAIFAIGLANRARLGLGVVIGGALAYGVLYAVTSAHARRIADLNPNVFDGLQMMAAAILVWLGWKIAMSEVGQTRADSRLARSGNGFGAGIAAGIGVVAVGTKSWSSAISAGLLFEPDAVAIPLHAFRFGGTALIAVASLSCLWLLGGLIAGRTISSPAALRTVNMAGGGCLALMAGVILVA